MEWIPNQGNWWNRGQLPGHHPEPHHNPWLCITNHTLEYSKQLTRCVVPKPLRSPGLHSLDGLVIKNFSQRVYNQQITRTNLLPPISPGLLHTWWKQHIGLHLSIQPAANGDGQHCVLPKCLEENWAQHLSGNVSNHNTGPHEEILCGPAPWPPLQNYTARYSISIETWSKHWMLIEYHSDITEYGFDVIICSQHVGWKASHFSGNKKGRMPSTQ